MAQYSSNIREKEVKNRLRKDYFKDYDTTPILGDVDFAVAVPADGAAALRDRVPAMG